MGAAIKELLAQVYISDIRLNMESRDEIHIV